MSNSRYIFIAIVLIFLLLRLPGLDMPYHQDEAKWVYNSVYTDDVLTGMSHPPLSGLTFYVTAKVFGSDWFRSMTLIFSLANLLVLYLLVSWKYGKREAMCTIAFYTIAFYSMLGSLMVDTDGAILPFFFLLSFYAYLRFKEVKNSRTDYIRWGMLLILAISLGLLTKLSFVLIPATFLIDIAWDRKDILRQYWRWFLYSAAVVACLVAIIFVSTKSLLTAFNMERILTHARDFIRFSGRNYFQTLFQLIKALMYISPLPLTLMLLVSKDQLRKLRPLFVYFMVGFMFYVVLFDFSSGALDKYFLFLVAPLSIVTGVILGSKFEDDSSSQKYVFWGLGLSILIFLSQFLPHVVPPLYPKQEWISRVVSFKWNFVTPFMGGSGPVGFYISWLFIMLAWLVSSVLAILGRWRILSGKGAIVAMALVCIIYNAIFIEEYLFGKINGNSSQLLGKSLERIYSDDSIQKVMTYNDIGGYYLILMGKYERRVYAVPKYEKEYVGILNNFKEYYLVIDIPRISPESMFGRYFSSCQAIEKYLSGKMSATIYDCKNAIKL